MLHNQILVSTIHEKYKKVKENNEFKLSPPTWNDNLNYLTDHILYLVLKAIKILYHQQHETLTNSRHDIYKIYKVNM